MYILREGKMRKIILYTAASVDNFIARDDGDVSWLHSTEYKLENKDFGYADFYNAIDTTLMGNNTYKKILSFNIPFPYIDKTNFVFSHNPQKQDAQYVQFISKDVVSFVHSLKKQEGKDIWLVGGGEINSLLLTNRLIDKIILTIVPIMLGAGVSLFKNPKYENEFDLEDSTSFRNGMVQLILKVK